MIDAQWQRCRAWILPSLALWDMPEAELVERLRSGLSQLWPGETCAAITTLVAQDERRMLIPLVGGNLNELLTLLPGAEAWGRSHGAEAVYIDGRRGWRRLFSRMGYAPFGDGMRKAL